MPAPRTSRFHLGDNWPMLVLNMSTPLVMPTLSPARLRMPVEVSRLWGAL